MSTSPVPAPPELSFDVIIVGSGIASSFFLQGLLQSASPPPRILVLEAGPRLDHVTQLQQKRFFADEAHRHFVNRTPKKIWHFSRAFGGGTNCWFGSTPRMLPVDFKLRSTYGVGEDWPFTYDELEPFYVQAERLMGVAGAPEAPYPMSAPYPLPPHRFSEPDEVLRQAYPDGFFHLPTARSSRSDTRAPCCNNGVCSLCPVDAKFTIANGLSSLYSHPSVTLRSDSPVMRLEHQGNRVTGVTYRSGTREITARADLVMLGANALFNPHLLLSSGIDHPETGLGLCEQVGATFSVTFDGLQNFLGSTVTTGIGFNDMLGDHRRERAGFVYHTVNRPRNLSLRKGRELCTLEVIVAIEDLRLPENRVLAVAGETRPVIDYTTHSAYAQRTFEQLPALMAKYLAPLPIETLEMVGLRPTESHIQGTTVMGVDPNGSVVDRHGVHHAKRNLVVLGSGGFPTASPANPSLTIAAWSLFSAHHLAA